MSLRAAALAVLSASQVLGAVTPRSDCTVATVVSGDSCGTLAKKCGISAADFTKYNPSSTLCSTLTVGQRVCCSAGTLPDITPKPTPDGICAKYTVVSGDYCAAIAAANGITVANLQTYNADVWHWAGCDALMVGQIICLSTGKPPLPAPVDGTNCGPTVPGTTYPADGDIADLNPCPDGQTCSEWGYCQDGSK